MPIYEYHCLKCGADFEKLVSSSGAVETRCPACNAAEVERKLSTFAASVSSTGGSCSQGGGSCAPGGG